MVSQLTSGYRMDSHGRPFARRRHVPAIVLMVVLLVAAIAVWIVVFSKNTDEATGTACPQPPTPTTPPSGKPSPAWTGSLAARGDVAAATPAVLSTVSVRVFNGNGQRGQAEGTLTDLTTLGFRSAPEPSYGDDPYYYDYSLACVGQIRFGDGGVAQAASVWLALPCAELIRDDRRGAVVDVVLGKAFTAIQPTADAAALLGALRQAAPADAGKAVDRELLRAVQNAPC